MDDAKRKQRIRRCVLAAGALATAGLLAFHLWDVQQDYKWRTRFYREFYEVEIIAREFTNDGWAVYEPPPVPGPYRLVPNYLGQPGQRGSEVSIHVRSGKEEFHVHRDAPDDKTLWIVPLQTKDGKLTYAVLESKQEVAMR
jgi:hypothetical protein